MDKYIRLQFKNGYMEENKTEFEYELGEEIRVNSSEWFKCMDIIKDTDKIIYEFKEGITTRYYSW